MTDQPNTPEEHILVRRGEPVLDTSVLDELAELIEQLYPGAWSVQAHSEDYPDDFAVRTESRDVLAGPLGHENLARYIEAVQPGHLRGILADNKRLRLEIAQLRAEKTRLPES